MENPCMEDLSHKVVVKLILETKFVCYFKLSAVRDRKYIIGFDKSLALSANTNCYNN